MGEIPLTILPHSSDELLPPNPLLDRHVGWTDRPNCLAKLALRAVQFRAPLRDLICVVQVDGTKWIVRFAVLRHLPSPRAKMNLRVAECTARELCCEGGCTMIPGSDYAVTHTSSLVSHQNTISA